MPRSSHPHHPVLLMGDFIDPEFQGVVALLRGTILHQRLHEAETLREALETTRHGRQLPELVVICQTWSDQFAAREILELIAWVPFARLICCYGPWCDSDGRSRDLWPLGVRIPAAEAVSVVAEALQELQVPFAAQPPSSGMKRRLPAKSASRLPLTASRAEIYAARYGHPAAASLQSLTVAVNSPDRAWREMIEKHVRGCQGEVLSGDPEAVPSLPRQPDWLVWDADPLGPSRSRELDQWRRACPRLRVLACVGFPRADLTQLLRQSGVDVVWPKLAPLADFVEVLARDVGAK